MSRTEHPTDEHWLHNNAAVAIARGATAHNSGETVLEYWRDGESMVLRMSSWPRANEAAEAFHKVGWKVEGLPDDGKGHTLIKVTGGNDAE